jgi:hypothetical protein
MRTKWVQFRYVTLRLQYTDNQLAEEFQRIIAERDQLAERVPAPPQWAIRRVQAEESRAKEVAKALIE